MTDKLTNEQREEKARLAKIKRLNWVIENIGKIAEQFSLYGDTRKRWDTRKLDCSYIEEWDEWGDDILRICFAPFMGTTGSFDIKIHEEELDRFIDKYLKWKGKKAIDDPEVSE
jgi:hypothetical protein